MLPVPTYYKWCLVADDDNAGDGAGWFILVGYFVLDLFDAKLVFSSNLS